MASFANQPNLVTQAGVNAGPSGYTSLGQGNVPSSQPDHEISSLQWPQSDHYPMDLHASTEDMGIAGPSFSPPPGLDTMQESSDLYSDNSMMISQFLDEPNIWSGTPAAPPHLSATPYFNPAVDMTDIYHALTIAPPHLSDTPFSNYAVDMTGVYHAPNVAPPHLSATSYFNSTTDMTGNYDAAAVAPLHHSTAPYINSAADMTGIYSAPTVAPLHHSAIPYINSATENTVINAAPMPPPPSSVAREFSVLQNVAESAEPRGTRRTEEAWAKHRSTIKKLYMDQGMALPSLMDLMKKEYGFYATQKRYKEKFRAWGFKKNLTRKHTKFITRIASRRRDEEGKKTEFHHKGKVIPQDKVDRHLAKPNIRRSPTGSTPSGMSYETVRPDSQSLVSRTSSTPRSRETMFSPSRPQSFSAARYQRRRLDDLDTTKELTLQWQGLNLEALRDLHSRATNLANQGNEHEKALMMFWEAMDGFESLVGATHYSTVEVLSSFVEFCLKAGFYDEAKDRMQKSLADHQAQFGDLHQQTLMSMVRLGCFYLVRKQFGNAELNLVRARIGFEDLFRDNAEQVFVHTVEIGASLAGMYEAQGDFEKSEQEHLLMIRKGEALRGPYELQVLRLKHALVHLYIKRLQEEGDRIESGIPLKIERLLLECVEACEYTSIPDDVNVCCFELLREQYHTMGEDLKLKNLLVRIVHKIEAVGRAREVFADFDRKKLCGLKKGLARSYVKLGDHESAEWWYLSLQPELESYHGVNSRDALQNLMQIALFYLGQDESNEAEPYFREAQHRAETVLEQDDPIKEKIARCLTTRVYKSECRCCML